GRYQISCQFRHGDVVLGSQASEKKRAMGIELGVATSAHRLWRKAPRRSIGLHQVDDKRHRHLKVRRSRMPRMTNFDKPNDALTQINRKRMWHDESPPCLNESPH